LDVSEQLPVKPFQTEDWAAISSFLFEKKDLDLDRSSYVTLLFSLVQEKEGAKPKTSYIALKLR
jgi:hypothetical protein